MSLMRALGPGSLHRDARPNGPPRWVLDWTDAQGRRRRKTLSTDRRVAERLRSELIHDRDLRRAGLGGELGMAMPLDELARLHLADLGTRVTPHHLRNVRCILDRALEAITAVRVRDLRPHDLLVYRQRLVAEGRSHRWANLAVDRVRAMLAWGERVGLIAESPIRVMDRLPEGARHVRCRRRALSELEMARYLAAAEADDCAQIGGTCRRVVPQAPLWRFLIESGCRYGEAVSLTWGDVDLASRIVTVRGENSKSGRSRVIPLTQGMTLALLSLSKTHERVLGRAAGAGDLVFLTALGCRWPRNTVNAMRVHDRLLAKAGIARVDEQGRKIDLHSLRHTTASRFARSGVPLVVAQRILGHSTPVLTAKHYVHLGVEELREAVEGLPDPARPREAATRAS